MGERFFMMMNLKGEDSLVMQLVAGQCFQHRQHGSGFVSCFGNVSTDHREFADRIGDRPAAWLRCCADP